MNSIKRSNDDLKANRPTLEEVGFIPKAPISILVEDVRSVYNVGSIFRTADSFGAEKIYLSGITAFPPRDDLHKTALGAEKSVDIFAGSETLKVRSHRPSKVGGQRGPFAPSLRGSISDQQI